MRIDLYRSSNECFAFEAAYPWSGFVAIGWGHHFFLLSRETRQVLDVDLGNYFGQMVPASEYLLVASAERLFCFAQDGSLLWRSAPLGIDGVIVDQVVSGVVQGHGEWNPPGGWRTFTISLSTGEPV